MSNKIFTKDAMTILKETSRTFFIPIAKLSGDVQKAVASAYLCLRAIDEIEDHPILPNQLKAKLLREISTKLCEFTSDSTEKDISINFSLFTDLEIPEVSQRLGEWIIYSPEDFRGRIVDATAAMSDRMANWSERNFEINTVQDLDAYTFSVAGAVGLLLSDIWSHYENISTDRGLSIAFGRGLQSVNILRNKGEDLQRGVSWYPKDFSQEDMYNFALKNLRKAKEYIASLPKSSQAIIFCRIPLNLALATLTTMKKGVEKLSRDQVIMICDNPEAKEAQKMLIVDNDSENSSTNSD